MIGACDQVSNERARAGAVGEVDDAVVVERDLHEAQQCLDGWIRKVSWQV